LQASPIGIKDAREAADECGADLVGSEGRGTDEADVLLAASVDSYGTACAAIDAFVGLLFAD
jgi:hypothetical protein